MIFTYPHLLDSGMAPKDSHNPIITGSYLEHETSVIASIESSHTLAAHESSCGPGLTGLVNVARRMLAGNATTGWGGRKVHRVIITSRKQDMGSIRYLMSRNGR